MRLIDADALIDSIVNNQNTVHGHHEQLQILAIVNRYAVDLIKKAPTVEFKGDEREIKTYLDAYVEKHGYEPRKPNGGFTACPVEWMDCPHGSDGYVISCIECWESACGKWRDRR